MDVGRLNKRISFMKYEEIENEFHITSQKLVEYKTVWASVEPVNGKQFMTSSRYDNELTYNIYTRYFKDITPNMIIKFKDRYFQIESVINYREENTRLNFVCIEKVGFDGNNKETT